MPKLFGRNPAPRSGRPLGPILNVVPAGDDGSPAEVTLFGDVVREVPRDLCGNPADGMYISVDDVVERLEEVRDAPAITIRLNTGGGDLFAGVTIHDLLRSFAGRKTVIVEGIAASAGSLIMCAGDVVKLHEGSMVMIHNVQSVLFGYYTTSDLEKLIKSHRGTETSCKRIYGRRCKKSDAELQRMMDEETWLVGVDAISEGFADELTEEPEPEEGEGEWAPGGVPPIDAHLSADGNYLVAAGVPHLVAEVGSVPPWLREGGKPQPRSVSEEPGDRQDGGDAAQSSEEAVMIENTADLRREYPELAAAIAQEAVDAERQRIREIEDIEAAMADAAMVARAKFEEPMTAADLALANAQAQAKASREAGASFLAATSQDDEDSNSDEVDPDPSDEGADEDEEQREQRRSRNSVAAAVEFYNRNMRGAN